MLAALSLGAGYTATSTPHKSDPLSLTAGHVYSATFSEGPTPAIETTCVAYKVKPATNWLQLSTSFSASAGGEVWDHESLLFTLSGAPSEGETVSLRLGDAIATGAPFVLRISAPTIGAADSLTFKATEDTACPSEHCLVPDATTHLAGNVNTPKCSFDKAIDVVEQPISPHMPARTPLLVDVTSLLNKRARTLKIALVPDEKTAEGFWRAKLQLGGAVELVVSSSAAANANASTCGCHGPTWIEIDDGSGHGIGVTGHCYDKQCIDNKEAHWQHPLSDCARVGGQKPFCSDGMVPAPAHRSSYCCTSCAAGGCSAFYAPTDVGMPFACTKGSHITPLPNHGNTCSAGSTSSTVNVEAHKR